MQPRNSTGATSAKTPRFTASRSVMLWKGPWLILLVSLAAAAGLWGVVRRSERKQTEVRFAAQVQLIRNRIENRMRQCEFALMGCAGLFDSSKEVERDEWRAYTSALQASNYLGGVLGVGFAEQVFPADMPAHLRKIQADGFPDYAVWPTGERDVYFPIIYLEPFRGRNLKAFGYDMYSETVRRYAMERARDTGAAAVSGRVILVQENPGQPIQSGFLIYVPVYAKDRPHATLAERRAALRGFAYSPFRAGDFTDSIMFLEPLGVGLKLYDGDVVDSQHLLYDSSGRPKSETVLKGHRPMLSRTVKLEFNGCAWTAVVRSLPSFESAQGASAQWLAAVGGLLVSGLLFGLSTLLEGRVRALGDVKASEMRYRRLFESAKDGILILDADSGQIVDVNPFLVALLKSSHEEILGRSLWEIGSFMNIASSKGAYLELQAKDYVRYEDMPLETDDGRLIDVEFVSNVYMAGGKRVIQCNIRDISERKRTEESLRRERAFADNLVETAQTIILVLDTQGAIVSLNPYMEKLSGYRLDEVKGKDWVETFLPDEDRKVVRTELRRAIRGTPTKGNINSIVAADGRRMEIEWYDNLLKADDGSVMGLLAIGQDVTERKKAEEELRSAKAFLDNIINAIADPVFVKDDARRFVLANDALCAMVGRPREGLIGERDDDMFPAEQVAVFRRMDVQVLDTGEENVSEEALSNLSTAEVRTIVTRKTRYIDPAGKRFLVGVIRDITERKQTEEELRDSEKRFRTIFDAAAEGILVADMETRTFSYANPAIGRMLGYTTEELLRLSVEEIHTPEDRPRIAALLEAQAGGEMTAGADLPCLRGDGRVVYAAINTTWVELDGRPRLVSFFTDVTDRRVLEQQLNQAQKLESIGLLAGGVAHDFNNILTGIGGYARFAHDSPQADEEIKADLSEVLTLTKRAEDLTRQLLAFGRKQLLRKETLDLNALIANFIKMLTRLIGEHIAVTFRPGDPLSTIEADPSQVEQILMNLAINARDVMPDGGKLSIETANATLDEGYASMHQGVTPGDYVRLTVSDTGCGMDASTRERVFEPFFTTKELGKGTGLGLATVYGIVKQHGGNIWIYSEAGKGTTFKVYLPSAHGGEVACAAQKREAEGGSETILLVEDEKSVRHVTQRYLEAKGYHVLTAASPAEAEEVLAEHGNAVALLLTDVVMPGRSGRDLFESAVRRHPHLKVVFMSGYTDDTILHHGMLEADFHFVQKPFTSEGLAQTVREALDGE